MSDIFFPHIYRIIVALRFHYYRHTSVIMNNIIVIKLTRSFIIPVTGPHQSEMETLLLFFYIPSYNPICTWRVGQAVL